MREKLENTLWRFWLTVEEKFLRNERGDSNMVAVIVLIVIILFIAAIFQEQLRDAVDLVFEKLTDFIETV